MSKGNRLKASVKAPSGGAKLKAAGRHPILLGVSADQLMVLRKAASLELRPVTQFVLFHAMSAAVRSAETFGTPTAGVRSESGASSSSTKTPSTSQLLLEEKNRRGGNILAPRKRKAASHE